jgi:hypothetical protein
MPSSLDIPRDSTQRIRVVPEEVTLVVWPLRQEPLSALVALAIAAAISWLVAWSSQRAWLGVLAAITLAITLWRTWLPVTYEIGVSGVTQTVLGRRRRISWPAIRAHDVRGNGVLLVPDSVVAPLSPLRGLYIPWLDQRDKVLACVEYYLHSRGR